jgi:Tfp pilus assembly protein PilF
MTAQTDWLSAGAILLAGLVLGLLFLFMTRRRSKTALDTLIEQLRKPDLDPAERERLELQTAELLREMDEGVATEPVATSSFFASAMKGFGWGVATFAVLAALGYFVIAKASPKPMPVSAAPAAVSGDPLAIAQQELERDNLMGVFEQTKIVLDKDPENSRALTLQAIVRAAMGEGDRATELLQRAMKSDPANLDARVALAWVHAQNGRVGEAETIIDDAIKAVPSEKELLEKVRTQFRSAAAKPPL